MAGCERNLTETMKTVTHGNYSVYYVTRIIGRDPEGNLRTAELDGPFLTKDAAIRALTNFREAQPQFEFVLEEENELGESRIDIAGGP